MAKGFASYAWLLKGLTASIPGWLEFDQGRLRFRTPEEVLFDVAPSDIAAITFPWYYFGGGMKLRIAGRLFRISFVRPNGAEYAAARSLASFGDSASLLLAAVKVSDIRTGRDVGRRWRELLGTPSQQSDPKLGEAVRKANSEWEIAMRTGDAATIAAPYADDGVFVFIDGTCIHGRTEVEKMYRVRFGQSGVATSARIDLKTLVVDGDLAFESGFGEIEAVRGGQPSKSGSRYLTVWQRRPDGEWRIIRNIILP